MENGSSKVLPHTAILPLLFPIAFFAFLVITATSPRSSEASQTADNLESITVSPAVSINKEPSRQPTGLSPQLIKEIYELPTSDGNGSVALITAYDYPQAEADLGAFSKQFGLSDCTVKNGCLEVHAMADNIKSADPWSLASALSLQWAHAIAPKAKLILVEAKSDSASDLLEAVDYARSRSDVVSVAMGWGSQEFSSENAYNDHFADENVAFFAAANETKNTLLWPAVAPDVIGVGGTTLVFSQGKFVRETAWGGGGGGISKYIPQPSYQLLAVPMPKGKRAVPDVSFNADPSSGVAVFMSAAGSQKGWYQVGGTAVGTTIWAAVRSIGGKQLNLRQLYIDAMANSDAYFRDITEGANGSGFYCQTGEGYDFITGLGSPITTSF